MLSGFRAAKEGEAKLTPLDFKFLQDKKYQYGKHLVPHDAGVHEYSSGLTRLTIARNLAVSLLQTPNLSVDEGIDAVRNILHRCWFDEAKCSSGIKALESYRRQWNEKQRCWSSHPLHNHFSHGADAFRTLAVGLRRIEEKNASPVDARTLGYRDQLGLYSGHALYTNLYRGF